MRYQVNSGPVIGEVIDGEAVIINLTTGNYYSLNESGATIWDSLGHPTSLDEIVARLTSRFDAPAEQVETDARALLEDLEREQLIVAAEENGALVQAGSEPALSARARYQPPRLEKHTDMQDLILLDPVHEVGEQGWPNVRVGDADSV
jgi:Coenzyme PQQ synthesis protein D (PqqD)